MKNTILECLYNRHQVSSLELGLLCNSEFGFEHSIEQIFSLSKIVALRIEGDSNAPNQSFSLTIEDDFLRCVTFLALVLISAKSIHIGRSGRTDVQFIDEDIKKILSKDRVLSALMAEEPNLDHELFRLNPISEIHFDGECFTYNEFELRLESFQRAWLCESGGQSALVNSSFSDARKSELILCFLKMQQRIAVSSGDTLFDLQIMSYYKIRNIIVEFSFDLDVFQKGPFPELCCGIVSDLWRMSYGGVVRRT